MCINMHEENIIVHNAREQVLQYLCPRELITLVRCKRSGLNYTEAAYRWKYAMRNLQALLLNLQCLQGPQHFKVIEKNQLL